MGPSRDNAHCARRRPIKATKDAGSIPATSTRAPLRETPIDSVSARTATCLVRSGQVRRIEFAVGSDGVLDLVAGVLSVVADHDDWLVVDVEALVGGGVELASRFVCCIGVESGWAAGEIQAGHESFGPKRQLLSRVGELGLDASTFGLDGVTPQPARRHRRHQPGHDYSQWTIWIFRVHGVRRT
jgi:hypothetical protein